MPYQLNVNPVDLNGLTDEQKRLAGEPPDARLLVISGPGTGKTHLLIARLATLIAEHQVKPAGGFLILSFSRAAVGVIRSRAREAGGDLAYIRVQTFDSFATRLLYEFDPGGHWERDSSGYDKRIEYAVNLIKADQRVRDHIKGYASVFIDELQDIVGIRSTLVQTILDVSEGGFTILGDPAQGIYNFQLQGGARLLGSSVIFDWLRKEYAGSLQLCELTVNHRARSPVAKSALFAGPLLNAPCPNYRDIKQRLDRAYAELHPLTEPHQAVSLLKKTGGTTAILCRNNGQALVISRELWYRGIDHCVQRYATDRVLPVWIGACVSRMQVTRPGMTTVKEEISARTDIDPDEGWGILKRIEAEQSRLNLDLDVMAGKIRTGAYPDDLCDTQAAAIMVSTVHKAKGLQFERVIVAGEYDDRSSSTVIPAAVLEEEGTRLLYVALTRPENELYSLPDLRYKGILRKCQETDRWFLQFGKYCVKYFEVCGDDSDSAHPTCSQLLDQDALETQTYISHHVRQGDDVAMEYIGQGKDLTGCDFHCYVIEHSGRRVGLTTAHFGRCLQKTVKLYPWRTQYGMPKKIEGLKVEAVDTVAGLPGTARQTGTGVADIWLRVRACGFGVLVY